MAIVERNTDRTPSRRRRILWATIGVAVVLALVGWFARNQPWARRWALHGLALAYAAYDPAGDAWIADVGPVPGAATPPIDHDDAKRLHDWFPTLEARVRRLGASAPRHVAIEFRHEPIDSPASRQFADATAEHWKTAKNLFELCNSVRGMTEHGVAANRVAEDEPLACYRAATSQTPLTCRPFSLLLLSLCVQKGYTARMLGLSRTGDAWNHAVVEAYDPELGKWVLLDPDFNVAYRRGSVWLDAREIQEAWSRVKRRFSYDGDLRALHESLASAKKEVADAAEIEVVALGAAGESLRESNLRGAATGLNLELFEIVAYHCRNDYLTNRYPIGHPVAVRQFLLREDRRTLSIPIDVAAIPIVDPGLIGWPVGRCRIDIVGPANDLPLAIECRLSTYAPNFAGFEGSFDGNAWLPIDGHSLVWTLKLGHNALEIRSVNSRGLKGEPAGLEIELSATK